jgi:hypothetical protein
MIFGAKSFTTSMVETLTFELPLFLNPMTPLCGKPYRVLEINFEVTQFGKWGMHNK